MLSKKGVKIMPGQTLKRADYVLQQVCADSPHWFMMRADGSIEEAHIEIFEGKWKFLVYYDGDERVEVFMEEVQ